MTHRPYANAAAWRTLLAQPEVAPSLYDEGAYGRLLLLQRGNRLNQADISAVGALIREVFRNGRDAEARAQRAHMEETEE